MAIKKRNKGRYKKKLKTKIESVSVEKEIESVEKKSNDKASSIENFPSTSFPDTEKWLEENKSALINASSYCSYYAPVAPTHYEPTSREGENS